MKTGLEIENQVMNLCAISVISYMSRCVLQIALYAFEHTLAISTRSQRTLMIDNGANNIHLNTYLIVNHLHMKFLLQETEPHHISPDSPCKAL